MSLGNLEIFTGLGQCVILIHFGPIFPVILKIILEGWWLTVTGLFPVVVDVAEKKDLRRMAADGPEKASSQTFAGFHLLQTYIYLRHPKPINQSFNEFFFEFSIFMNILQN